MKHCTEHHTYRDAYTLKRKVSYRKTWKHRDLKTKGKKKLSRTRLEELSLGRTNDLISENENKGMVSIKIYFCHSFLIYLLILFMSFNILYIHSICTDIHLALPPSNFSEAPT